MRSFFALTVTLSVVPFALAQDQDDANRKATQNLLDRAEGEYRTYFKRPESTYELWAAVKFEIDVGKFDLAALHLKRLVENKAEHVDEDLFKIEGVEGSSTFIRLLRVRNWSDHAPFQKEAEESVKTFFERLNKVLDHKLGDPERINRFIRQLDGDTAEERTFAFTQLNRSGERAVPYLVERLQESLGKPLYHRIVEAMVNLKPETVPAYLEVLKARDEKDALDQELRLTLLRILRKRGDQRVVPYLWHLSASRLYPPLIRETAQNVLADFLNVDKIYLPPAKLALVDLSNRYFKHEVKLPERMRFWKWDGTKIAVAPIDLKAADAEELFGVRYALEALDLDPAFVPAQIAFLNMTIERTVLHDFEQAILKPMPPATQRLVATLDADLILRVQERAYEEGNIPIILGAIRALGDRGELRAAKPSSHGSPQGVVRGLSYPDRRVQFQAVNAILKMPFERTPVAAPRTVEVLRRLVTVDQPPAALIVGAAVEQANAAFAAVKEAGLAPLPVKSIQDGLARARSLGNVEAIFLHYGLTPRELPYALTQIRGDVDYGQTPIIVVAPSDMVPQYQNMAARTRHVKVLSESLLPSADEVKKVIDELTASASVAKLSPEERKAIAARSLDILHQMARNQIPGYDVRSTLENVALSLRSDNAPIALEILGRLPGSVSQIRLADVILDPTQDKLRIAAARELNRLVQNNGTLLPKAQFDKLKALYSDNETDIPLRTELSYFVGSFPTTPTRDGARIFQFRPDPAIAPAPNVPPPAEKEKEKEMEKEKKDE